MNLNLLSSLPELQALGATCLLTGLLWLPYIINRFRELGPPTWQLFPPADPAPRAPWAGRAQRAHENAVENLVIFAPLALAVVVGGIHDAGTAQACQIYLWARLLHAVIYISGLPIVPRTMAFLVGVGAQIYLALRLLG